MMDTPYSNMQDENRNRALVKPGHYPLSQSGYQYSYPDAEELHIRDYIQVILRSHNYSHDRHIHDETALQGNDNAQNR